MGFAAARGELRPELPAEDELDGWFGAVVSVVKVGEQRPVVDPVFLACVALVSVSSENRSIYVSTRGGCRAQR